MAGVITGIAVALHAGQVRLLASLAALFIALLLQIGSNLANDVFDHERGADAARAFGPTRVTESGMLTPAEVKRGMLVVFGMAGVLGLYLAITVHWLLIPVGLLAILAAVGYTAGPYPLGYHGLGELFVFVFFGFVSVAGTTFLNLSRITQTGWGSSVPMGLLIVGILVVNNLRDIETDRASGKRTQAVRLGESGSVLEYTIVLILAYAVLGLAVLSRAVSPWALLAILSLPLAWQLRGKVAVTRGRALNRLLAETGQLVLVFSLLYSLGLVVSRFLG
jgi:1,4-dihydroxy-2-naphthoate octaprenyltransferase